MHWRGNKKVKMMQLTWRAIILSTRDLINLQRFINYFFIQTAKFNKKIYLLTKNGIQNSLSISHRTVQCSVARWENIPHRGKQTIQVDPCVNTGILVHTQGWPFIWPPLDPSVLNDWGILAGVIYRRLSSL